MTRVGVFVTRCSVAALLALMSLIACGGGVDGGTSSTGAGAGGAADGSAGTGTGGATGGAGGGPSCGTGGIDRCGLPAAPGSCDGAFPRFYFDVAAGKCMQFTYGGCGGNDNNFQSLEECSKACDHRADQCSLCDPNGSCIEHDCAACPETRDCSGTTCSIVGLSCVFLPSCGATTCTCKDDTGESAAWQCIPNLC